MRRDPCQRCGAVTKYSGHYDRFLCAECRDWTDEACGCQPEDNCPFPKSPDKPSAWDIATAEDL